MDTQTTFFAIFIGTIVWIFLLYNLIRGAVFSAMNDHLKLSRMNQRLVIQKMLKDGFTKEEIHQMLTESDEQFWNRIPSSTSDDSHS